MCNEIARRIALGQLREDWSELKVPLVFPDGLPNLGAQDSIRITDTALVLRAGVDVATPCIGGAMRRWSWPGQGGRPVYNYRSEGRTFPNGAREGRCLIPVDAFFEFTVPPPDAPPRSKKTKWRFTAAAHGPLAIGQGDPWFCIAGFWRATPVGEAFTLLTAEPGPDVAPYHHRQVVCPAVVHWTGWLDGSLPAADVLRPSPGGALQVAPA